MGNAAYTIQPSGYEHWVDYPDSPVTTADYPYQAIVSDQGTWYLLCCATRNIAYQPYYGITYRVVWTFNGTNYATCKRYTYRQETDAWDYETDVTLIYSSFVDVLQCNHDIKTPQTNSDEVYLARTTDGTVSAGGNIRIRNMRQKSGSFVRAKSAKHKDTDGWKRVNL